MIQEDLPLRLFNGVHIPRRKRSGSVESISTMTEDDEETSISMMEVATIMIAMANGGHCKRKRKKSPAAKQRKKPRRKDMELGKSPPEMPAAMRDRIVGKGGYGIQLVIQKQLEKSDVNRNYGRLCLPGKKVRTEFVTDEERKLLDEENGEKNKKKKKKKKKGMEVGIMDDFLKERLMWLKKWKIGSDRVYCLMNNWNRFVEENGLRSGDFIQLWSFRNNNSDRLCFAIVKLSQLL